MSSDQEITVKVSADNGYKTQWTKGLFYRKEGIKFVFKSEKTKYGIFVLFLVTTLLILFQDSSELQNNEDDLIRSPEHISSLVSPIQLQGFNEQKALKKNAVLKKNRIERLSVISRTENLEVPLGSSAKAMLVTGATNGPVKAKLLEDVELNGEVYIQEGSVLWGKGASTESRLIVVFSKYVTEDGVAKDIKATAYDISDQILGLKGSIIGRTSKKLLAGAGLGVAAALQTMQKAENVGGVAVVKPSIENALLSGASNAALGMAEQEFEELKDKQNIIEVKKNTEIHVVFGEL